MNTEIVYEEGIRYYLCRLVEDEERLWTNENVDKMALKHFPNIDRQESLRRPILYSNWLSKDYVPVDQEELRNYVKARLKVGSLASKLNYIKARLKVGSLANKINYVKARLKVGH